MPFVKRQNTHQTHFEDLVLLGPNGLDELDDKIEGMLERLEDKGSRLNTTIKIDGAPALFCWSSYSGYPDNSIALKAFTNGPQTALSSVEEIQQKYPTEDRANMREMLRYGLELAKYIPAGECWQGDCLFTKDSKKEENIDGTDYITFQPNKIIYAFSEDQPGYEEVKNADFGIAFHTIYRGEDKKQTFNVDRSRLNVPSNIYVMSPAISVDTKSFNLNQIKAQVNKLHSLEGELLSNKNYETLVSNEEFMDFWNTFENKTLADNKQVTINETTFINELKEHIKEKLTQKASKLKTEKGRANYMTKIDELAQLVDNNSKLLTVIVKTLNEAAKIKMLLWEGFKQTKTGYDTYYKSRTKGYFKGDMEGIRMSDQDGNIVKIVDRTNFSSYNRDPDIIGGWERESLEEDMELTENVKLYMSYGYTEEEAKEIERLKRVYPDAFIPKLTKDGVPIIPREWDKD